MGGFYCLMLLVLLGLAQAYRYQHTEIGEEGTQILDQKITNHLQQNHREQYGRQGNTNFEAFYDELGTSELKQLNGDSENSSEQRHDSNWKTSEICSDSSKSNEEWKTITKILETSPEDCDKEEGGSGYGTTLERAPKQYGPIYDALRFANQFSFDALQYDDYFDESDEEPEDKKTKGIQTMLETLSKNIGQLLARSSSREGTSRQTISTAGEKEVATTTKEGILSTTRDEVKQLLIPEYILNSTKARYAENQTSILTKEVYIPYSTTPIPTRTVNIEGTGFAPEYLQNINELARNAGNTESIQQLIVSKNFSAEASINQYLQHFEELAKYANLLDVIKARYGHLFVKQKQIDVLSENCTRIATIVHNVTIKTGMPLAETTTDDSTLSTTELPEILTTTEEIDGDLTTTLDSSTATLLSEISSTTEAVFEDLSSTSEAQPTDLTTDSTTESVSPSEEPAQELDTTNTEGESPTTVTSPTVDTSRRKRDAIPVKSRLKRDDYDIALALSISSSESAQNSSSISNLGSSEMETDDDYLKNVYRNRKGQRLSETEVLNCDPIVEHIHANLLLKEKGHHLDEYKAAKLKCKKSSTPKPQSLDLSLSIETEELIENPPLFMKSA